MLGHCSVIIVSTHHDWKILQNSIEIRVKHYFEIMNIEKVKFLPSTLLYLDRLKTGMIYLLQLEAVQIAVIIQLHKLCRQLLFWHQLMFALL